MHYETIKTFFVYISDIVKIQNDIAPTKFPFLYGENFVSQL